jgi:hypothetical protein
VRELASTRAPIRSGETDKSRPSQCLTNVLPVEGPPRVVLAGESEKGVGPDEDITVHRPRQVNPEEGIFGIGYRVDEPSYQMPRCLPEAIVRPAKRDDPRLGVAPGANGNPVRLEPRANDREVAVEASSVAPRQFQTDKAATLGHDRDHFCPEPEFA